MGFCLCVTCIITQQKNLNLACHKFCPGIVITQQKNLNLACHKFCPGIVANTSSIDLIHAQSSSVYPPNILAIASSSSDSQQKYNCASSTQRRLISRVHFVNRRRPRASEEPPAPPVHIVVCLHQAPSVAVASVSKHCYRSYTQFILPV